MKHLPLRLARWSARHPWRAIGGWLALVAVTTAMAATIGTTTATDEDYRRGDSGRAAAALERSGLAAGDQEHVLIRAGDPVRAEAASRDLTARLQGVPGARVAPAVWSPDHTVLLTSISSRGDPGSALTDMQQAVERVQHAHPGVQMDQTGDLSLTDEINARVADDLSSAESTSLPVTLLLMLIAFGALLAAGIPVLLALTSVGAAMGLLAPLSRLVHAEPSVSSVVVLIGMAVGVDYSLFYLKRAREERDRGHAPVDAVEIAAATSGHSIVVSGMAVIVSMSGLLILSDVTFTSLAVGAMLVVAVAMVGSLTVLPALLSRLGHWVDRPRVPLLWRLNRRIGQGGVARRVLGPVLRRPAAAVAGSLAVMIALAVPAMTLQMQRPNLETLPQDMASVSAYHDMTRAFPGSGSSVDVVVEHPAGAHATPILRDVADGARATGDWSAMPTDLRTSDDGTVTTLRLTSTHPQGDPRSAAGVHTLREQIIPRFDQQVAGSTWLVGGEVAADVDANEHVETFLPYVIGFVLLLTFVMMAVTFRSVVVALVTTGLNLLSVGAAFGVLALVFQHTWAEGLLSFTSTGAVIDWIPLFLFVVLVGLSMDYHVFVLSRVREHVRSGTPAREAVRRGLVDTAGVVTSAAAVMVSVFSLFVTLSMVEMKQMGVGLAVAVALDATLVRVVLLPSVLTLLGERAWGRRHAGRWQLDEAPSPAREPVGV